LYNVKGKAFNIAVLDRETEIDFNYFPDVTIVSGISDDRIKVKDVVRSYIENSSDETLSEDEMESLLEAKLESKRIVCKTKTLSQIIAQEKISKIDLLKVDVENSEHLVIDGLSDSDWDKIENIIIEVHDLDGRLENIKALLARKGYTTYVEKEEMLSKDDILYNLFAIRENGVRGLESLGDNENLRLQEWQTPVDYTRFIRNSAEANLPAYMVPSHFVLMDQLPLTCSGKVDKNALPAFDEGESLVSAYVAPENEMEQKLVNIWLNLLELEQVGVNDDFFEIGGHSLLAVRLIGAIRKELNIEVDMTSVFDYPTIASFVQHIGADTQTEAMAGIVARKPGDVVPLSFSQERMWFIDRLEGTVQYHVPTILKLEGKLNIQTLTATIRNIIERHEVLRSTIVETEAGPVIRILPASGWDLNVLDGAEFENNEAGLKKFIHEQVMKPFILSKDYMVRASLVRFSDTNHTLVVTVHHIASDGWSIGIIVKEFMTLFAAKLQGRIPQLPKLAVQYGDYAIWQRKHITGEYLEEKLGYWRNRLQGFSNLQLPTDFPRPVFRSINGARISFKVSKETSEALNKISRNNGSTLFMSLFAGFNILLQRYSSQDDICVGTPVANRTMKETEPLIGYFINTLALRTDLSGNPSFNQLVQKVKENTLEAFGNQEVPFEKVVEAVVKERDLNRNPIYQVLFTMQNTPKIPELVLNDIKVTTVEAEHETSQIDMICNVAETEDGLLGSVEYCTDLFKASTIERMMAHYTAILDAIAATPTAQISDLGMLATTEEHRLLVEFNQYTDDAHTDVNVVALFETQAALNPDAMALVFRQDQLTYKQLNEQANKLANYLIAKGVKPGQKVPLFTERSFDMVVGILGILKTGAAYVPIDIEFPTERIAFMVNDINAKVMVTAGTEISRLSSIKNVDFVDLDRHASEISKATANNPGVSINPEHLAYIIYTSGTTGTPKGVMVTHANLSGYLRNEQTSYIKDNSNKAGSYLHLSYTFDASLTGLFMPLIHGKFLVLSSKKSFEVFDDRNLWTYAPYDFIKLTPSHLELIKPKFKTDKGELITNCLVLGGEALFRSQFVDFIEDGLDIDLVNEYGPTEATIGCTIYTVNTKTGTDFENVPIGKPITNSRIYILGNNMELLPVGVSGEIYIGGFGITQGYLNQPELTAEKFVNDPFATSGNTLIYKTGDIGKWTEDGNIEYLGRKDEQLKIHGYRIEPGEIESAIRQSLFARDAVVTVNEDHHNNKRLLAYVIPESNFSKSEIMGYLMAKLPEYMVPHLWVELDQFPLTTNGKVDKRALPHPDLTEGLAESFAEARNETEARLVEIWKDVLELDKVGINDNFFDLGGDSIIIIQIVSRSRKAGFEFQIGDVFNYQTIARLAAFINQKAQSEASAEGNAKAEGTFNLTPIQQWFFNQNHKHPSHFNQSILLTVKKTMKGNLIEASTRLLIDFHDTLRLKYQREGNQWQQTYAQVGDCFYTEDLRHLQGAALKSGIEAVTAKYQQNLDIEKGKLLSVVWIQTPDSEADNRIFIVMHHLVTDGVTWRILLEDFDALLNTHFHTRIPEMGQKTASYLKWQHSLEQFINDERVTAQKSYWLGIAEQYQPLPYDKAFHGAPQFKDIEAHTVSLNADLTKQLLQDAPAVFHSEINDLLLAALYKTLTNWTGNNNIIIGLEGHGREDRILNIDTTRTSGWFTSMYPLLLSGRNQDDNTRLIRSVKEQIRRVPMRGLGYGLLKYLNQTPGISDRAAYDVVFNYLGQSGNTMNQSKWLGIANEKTGNNVSVENNADTNLSVVGMVHNGQMQFRFDYNNAAFNASTIENLATAFSTNLQELVNHCLSIDAKEVPVSPADFNLSADAGIDDMDTFMAGSFKGKPRREQVESIYRLSGLQQGILYHNLYAKNAGAYIVQFACDLISPDIDNFIRSWDVVMQNHTSLRSAFYHNAFDVPVQCVYKTVKMPLEIRDLSGQDAHSQQESLNAFLAEDMALGFNFEEAPLMRITLLKTNNNRYRMVWTFHHLLFDGWSMPVLIQEFLGIYDANAHGTKLKVSNIDKFEDYINYIESRDKASEKAYWQKYFTGLEEGTLLPFVQAGTAHNKGVGQYDTVYLNLDKAITSKVQAFTQEQRITVNTLMQGVWAFLLHAYTNSSDIAFGSVVSGRPDDLPGVEQRVGMYINTLPLHSQLNKGSKMTDWLKTIQEQQVQSRNFQYSTLSDIQSWTGIQGDLFDSILVFENYPINSVINAKTWELKVEGIQTYEQTNYPLTITIGSSDEINIRFRFNTGILDPVYVNAISNHFYLVMMQLLNNTGIVADDVHLLSPIQEETILLEFSQSKVAYPAEQSMVTLFEAQASRNPDAVAVSFEGQTLSYAVLNEKANRLAHLLLENGVKPEALIPVCIDRSPEMMVAMLGILKAGAAFVPVDPGYPDDRIAYIVNDTSAHVLICNTESAQKIKKGHRIEVIELDADYENLNAYSAEAPKLNIASNQLAYVIYTSGSTGRPKGVMIEHKALIDHCFGVIESAQLDKCKSFALFAPLVFDAGHSLIFSSLILGSNLHILSNKMLANGEALANYIKVNKIDCVKIVPSLWLTYAEDENFILASKVMIFGGEAFSRIIIDHLKQHNYSGLVFNHYGPTEATIGKTIHKVDLNYNYDSVPIGKPFSNTRLYLLDRFNHMVPVGVVGELYIAGDGLARGYLNNSTLTDSVFVADVFDPTKTGKMYKTGDYARWLPDGNIEYLGRVDEQVKIRGHRIETGEIESELDQSGFVKQSLVLAAADHKGYKRLIGYVVPAEQFDKEQLQVYLRSRLPEYMVPAIWVELNEMPLNANGKIDKKALPLPLSSDGLGENYTAPSNETEERLCAIWQDLLGVEKVGTKDNFFELGGHSLLVIRLLSVVKREFKQEISITTFFELLTIEELSRFIRLNQGSGDIDLEGFDSLTL
jgi:amino acid adenylation domain-containing protein/non-ribosomal peptide synthase protein (TIGR01720 family)/FkbM family methyltransferase